MAINGFELSHVQMMALRGRCLGWNVVKIGQETDRVPSTLSEHLQRAYHKLGFNKLSLVIEWAKESGNYLTEEEFQTTYGKSRLTPIEEIKARKAEEERAEIVAKAQADAMSAIHEEIGNNNYARY
jgi:hypothetical protein